MASHHQPTEPELLPGDIVQVIDKADRWFTALLVVEGVRSWGLQTHALMPTAEGVCPAYYRIAREAVVRVGTAALVDAEVATARKDAEATARAVAKESTEEEK